MTFPFPQITPYMRPAAVSFESNAVSTSSLTTYTFNSQAVGSLGTNASRHVVVCVGGNNDGVDVTAVTVGGIGATELVAETNFGGFMGIWIAPFTNANTTANIAVTFSASNTRCGICTYAVYNLQSAAARATQVLDVFSTGTTFNISLAVPRLGVAVAYGYTGGTGGPGSFTWTTMTENVDQTVSSTTRQSSALYTNTTQSDQTLTGTCVSSLNLAFEDFVAVSLR